MSRRRHHLVAALAVAALALAGCSSAGSTREQDGGPAPSPAQAGGPLPTDPITIRVALLPYATIAPLKLAEQKGWFEEAGITLETTDFNQGAQTVQALASDQADIAYVGSVSAVLAMSQGLPIVAFSDSDTMTTQGIYVLESSSIEEPKDLEGKTLAVAALRGLPDLTSQAPLEAEGVDYSSIDVVQVAPDAQEQALASGQVDAVWLAEPQRTIADANLGIRQITKELQGPTENMNQALWIASTSYWEQNPDDVRRFNAVMYDAMNHANENPDDVVETLLTYTALTPELAPAAVSSWVPDGKGGDFKAAMGVANTLMVKYGYIPEEVDLDRFIVDPS